MAGEDDSDKTEEPTSKRLDEAHDRGDVVKSQEVSAFFTLAAATLVVGVLSTGSTRSLVAPLTGLIEHAGELSTDGGGLRRLLLTIGAAFAAALALPVLAMMLAGVAGQMIQHRPVYSMETLTPKFQKISPMAGLKRLFSPEALANFLKGLLKLSLVAASMFFVVWPRRDQLIGLVSMDLALLLDFSQDVALEMMWAMLAVMFLIAAGDYMWVKFRWMKRQKMSLQEVKDEYKQTEGDPAVKGKIRQLRQERARTRMMAEVPKATVVVTNPTHYAVALKYETGMQAPICVAKGVDAVALRIREVAKANNVPVLENPPLARALYASLEIAGMVPEQHYKAVAEVIGLVMTMKKRSSWRS